MENLIREQVEESIKVKEQVLPDLIPEIVDATQAVINTLKAGGKVILFGNGGSAADAQHIAAELVNKLKKDRPSLAAMALTTDTSILTSIGNDYNFESIFSRQIALWAEKKDIAIAISTSGSSANILKAVETANNKGTTTIGLTGANGEKLCQLVKICLKVPSTSTPRIQEAHITIGHIICSLVEESLFGEGDVP